MSLSKISGKFHRTHRRIRGGGVILKFSRRFAESLEFTRSFNRSEVSEMFTRVSKIKGRFAALSKLANRCNVTTRDLRNLHRTIRSCTKC